MNNLRVGLIGVGMMGRNHLRVLSNLPGVDLVAVHDPAGYPHDIVRPELVLSSISKFKQRDVDYCVIAVPTIFHEEVALEVIAMGMHVFIEKPLAHSLESARRISDALRDARLVGAIGQIERYNPSLIEARRRIEDGQLGRIYEVFTRRQGWYPARIADVGVVKDLGTHDIDLTAWITQKKYEKVAAFTSSHVMNEHEDIVSISAMLEDKIVVNHIIDWLSPNKIRETRILGEKGCLIADTLNAKLAFYPNALYDADEFKGVVDGDISYYKLDKKEALRSEHENFRDYVLGISDNVATIDSGLETLKVVEAVLESARLEKSVNLIL